jgi:hypothetical protein
MGALDRFVACPGPANNLDIEFWHRAEKSLDGIEKHPVVIREHNSHALHGRLHMEIPGKWPEITLGNLAETALADNRVKT